MLIVLLGQLPLELWKQGTPEQQQEFVKAIAQVWGRSQGCKRVEMTVVEDGTFIYFFAECIKQKGGEI